MTIAVLVIYLLRLLRRGSPSAVAARFLVFSSPAFFALFSFCSSTASFLGLPPFFFSPPPPFAAGSASSDA